MSCIFRIKENMNNYTETEKRIAEYILANREEVINFSSQHFAKIVDTSPAAIIRFSKKVGYSGFTNLKVELAKDQTTPDAIVFDSLIRQDDSLKDVIQKNALANQKTFVNTYKLLNQDVFAGAVDALRHAQRIYLMGVGSSSLVCLDFFHKLVGIDEKVYYYTDYHLAMAGLSHIGKEDVLVSFSYSGLTREVVLAQKIAKEQSAIAIAITQVGKNDLSRHADFVLNIPKEESDSRLASIGSRYSMLVVSDLMYLALAQEELEATRLKIVKTRETIKKIRD